MRHSLTETHSHLHFRGVSYPCDKTMAHVLGQLLVIHQLLKENTVQRQSQQGSMLISSHYKWGGD